MRIINTSTFSLITLLSLLLFVVSCQTSSTDSSTATNNGVAATSTDNTAAATPQAANNNSNTSTTSTAAMTKGENNVSYAIHNSKGARKAVLGDFLTLHMKYSTMNDSVIFSSFNKGKPLSFKFQKTLFKGLLNEGVQQMGTGDSATFVVPGDSLYKDKLPRFLQPGDQIKYTIALQKVQSEQEYQKEQEDKRNAQLSKDAELIDKYLAENKIEGLTTTESGLRYKVNKKGEGKINPRDKVFATYKLTAVSPKGVTEIEDGSKKQELKIQTRGLREALTLLSVGSQATLVMPSIIAFGERRRSKIPENASLVYEIEINSAEGKAPVKK